MNAKNIAPLTAKTKYFPLSYGQNALWFSQQLLSNASSYNLPAAFRLTGALNTKALQAALQALIQRHASLRTRIFTEDGTGYQVIDAHPDLHIKNIDISDLDDSCRELEMQRMVTAAGLEPFDLSCGSLLRLQLYRLSKQEHVLLFVTHHILSDGLSLNIISRELGIFYEAIRTGCTASLPELALSYVDYVTLQRDSLTPKFREQEIDFWRRTLDGAPDYLDLASSKVRPSHRRGVGASYRLDIAKNVSGQLTDVAKKHAVTPFVLMAAASSILLMHHSAQTDLVVGVPFGNRTKAVTRSLVGLFVNIMPVRMCPSPSLRFVDFLHQVRATMFNGLLHQELPFDQLVQALQPPRTPNRNPIFQVMLNHVDITAAKFHSAGVDIDIVMLPDESAQFDLHMTMVTNDAGLAVYFQYDADIFDAASIERMAGHYQNLLTGIIENQNTRIGELPILTQNELHQLLVVWNDTAADYPYDQSIHQLFEAQVERTPHNIALVFEGRELTYEQLNKQANRLAHHLRNQGVGPDVLVGICVERSLDMIAGLLAILKAGGAYIPLDPAYPKERLADMLDDARPALLLTQQHLLASLPNTSSAVFCLDTDQEKLAYYADTNLYNHTRPGNLAYVIYTSGSTGKPKGIGITHGNAGVFIHWSIATFDQASLSKVLASTSICFDLSIFEIFVPLCQGGAAWLVKNILDLLDHDAAFPVTMINTVPSAIAEIHKNNAIPSTAKVINLAGEALANSLVQTLYQQASIERIHNLYGPTEDTIYSTYALTVKGASASCSIGRPIANTQIYLLDASLNPVPVGVAGELHIAGEGLARGYLKRPDLTADKFIPNPFSTIPGARMYKSGDLARYLPDGNIEYLGRIDHQVKIRGFRIELGEIEAALTVVPGVRDAVVLAREDIPDEKHLVAYVIYDGVSDMVPANLDRLRGALAATLPNYMMPSHFIALDKFPLTPNGKVNRKALPVPNKNIREHIYIQPRNAIEEMLARIWAEVLRLDKVGVKDDFFKLGGHSLLTLSVIAKLKKSGFSLTTKQFFLTPILEELANAMTIAEPNHASAAQGLITGTAPLLPNSHWFFQRRDVNHYNVSFLLEVVGGYSQDSLKKSIDVLLSHHDALRTILVQENDTWHQRFQAPEEMAPWWETVNLSAIADEDIDQKIHMVVVPAQASLDITRVRFRTIYFDLGKDRHGRILFIIHHELLDGYSQSIFLNDLLMLADGFERGLSPSLPEKTTSLKDLAEAYEQYALGTLTINNKNLSADRAIANRPFDPDSETEPYSPWDNTTIYWACNIVIHEGIYYRARWWTQGDNPASNNGENGHPWTICTVPPPPAILEELTYWYSVPWEKYLPLPIDPHPTLLQPDTGTSEPVFLREILSEQETQHLEELPRMTGASMDDILLTALVLAYGKWAGSRAVCVCVVNNGRSALPDAGLDLSRTVGYLINCLIRFFYLEDDLSPREAIASIQAQRNATKGKEADYTLLRFAIADPLIRKEMDNRPGPQLEQNFYPKETDDFEQGFRFATKNNNSDEAPLGSKFRPFSKAYFDKSGRFTLQWAYCPCMYTEDTARSLLNANISALRSLIQYFFSEQDVRT